MLSLNKLEKSKGTIEAGKRRGRGNASGRGNYSTRGMKGQRSRSGGKSGLASRSIKGYLLRIPKTRGFRSLQSKYATVNVGRLNHFDDGATVNARALLKAELVESIDNGLKILSSGDIAIKITVADCSISASAKELVEKVGGKVILK
jgi:large subunit ribosomal protein L15